MEQFFLVYGPDQTGSGGTGDMIGEYTSYQLARTAIDNCTIPGTYHIITSMLTVTKN